jgi:hypothetical protein
MVRTRADGLIGSQSCTTFTVTSSASMPAALSIMTTTAAGATVEILELEKDQPVGDSRWDASKSPARPPPSKHL